MKVWQKHHHGTSWDKSPENFRRTFGNQENLEISKETWGKLKTNLKRQERNWTEQRIMQRILNQRWLGEVKCMDLCIKLRKELIEYSELVEDR